MNRIITLLTLLALTSCLKSSKNHVADSKQSNMQGFVAVDTLIDNHRIVVIMDNVELTSGIENDIRIQINNIEAKDIVIYTSTSEATVKVGKQKGKFAVTPKLGIDQVGITVNYLGLEGLVKIGQVTIKTTHNKSNRCTIN
ncbi:MAG: hypothetical protein JEZ01_19375 [Labilibaculum sp.]|nr:hypothetical protein [Labilibaculum sp.]MBI9059935.1 hypothetical protein [Labilibaculum sp.]